MIKETILEVERTWKSLKGKLLKSWLFVGNCGRSLTGEEMIKVMVNGRLLEEV